MAQKSDSNDSGQPPADNWDGSGDSGKEFDDAVTSELSVERFTGMMVVPVDKDLDQQQTTNESDATVEQSEATSVPADAPLPTGYRLGDRFEIVALIHSGGMGHVYKAVDTRRHRDACDQVHVAIKMMRRSLGSRLDARVALEREAASTQHLSHPNIVNVFDFDQHDDQFYLVMEWLDGESLNALLRRTSGQRVDQQFAWRIVEGIARGLQNAHSNNVVHADINPSNIFITETQEVKLLDFGVARYANDAEHEGESNSVWVTRTYASPEVLSGMIPTFEDDIFALGCVAYRLLSGVHPFGGSSSREAQEAGTSVPRIPGLSEPHWKMLSRALSYDREDRPNSASVFYQQVPKATPLALLGDKIRGLTTNQWLMAGGVGAVLLAGAWWLSQPRVDSEPLPARETTAVELDATGTESEAAPDAAASPEAALADLLSRAAVAMDEQRLVAPDEDNARTLYREALLLDPANAQAAAGLRALSDTYVEQAKAALDSNAPQQVIEALTTAGETDPSNPAIAIVQQLLAAQANDQLSRARLAVAEGDPQRGQQLLSDLKRFPNVDAGAIETLRNEIAQGLAEKQLLARLEIADAHGLAGRLLTPASGNAQASLLQLKQDYEGDARIQAAVSRQAERLLARAGLAIAAEEFAEATVLLDAVDALGVMGNQVANARGSLQSTQAELVRAGAVSTPREQQQSTPGIKADGSSAAVPSSVNVPDTGSGSPTVAAATTATGDREAPDDAGATMADDIADEEPQIERSGPTLADPPVNETQTGQAGTTLREEAEPDRVLTLADLNIENYVAPRFPRGARRRDLEGFVELTFTVNPDGSTSDIETLRSEPSSIFVSSAEKAVRQWQFAPRESAIITKVTLNFTLAQ